jgi:hypothetical protein
MFWQTEFPATRASLSHYGDEASRLRRQFRPQEGAHALAFFKAVQVEFLVR